MWKFRGGDGGGGGQAAGRGGSVQGMDQHGPLPERGSLQLCASARNAALACPPSLGLFEVRPLSLCLRVIAALALHIGNCTTSREIRKT